MRGFRVLVMSSAEDRSACGRHRSSLSYTRKKPLVPRGILVRNRAWFLREIRECMDVFIVSIPDE